PVKRPAAGAGRGRGGRGGGGGPATSGGTGGGAGDNVAADAPATPPPSSAPQTREFPAGSYIVRMDQPYSRIAGALPDYQYRAPNDPPTRPPDDTRGTFPEGFGVQAGGVTEQEGLGGPMGPGKGQGKAAGRVSGTGLPFAINHNADNSLISLRYKLKDADIEVAEEPFESGGTKFNR